MSHEAEELLPWMTKTYFETVLKKFEGHDEIQLNEFRVNSGTKKGENFASAIKRVTLQYLSKGKSKELSLILKTSPNSTALSDALEEMGTFENETNVYQNILNGCQKISAELKIAPKLVHADKYSLVLEDLQGLNYKLANRKIRLNLAHAKVLLTKLAQLHALSSDLYTNDPSVVEPHMFSPNGNPDIEFLAFFFSTSMQESLKTIQSIPSLQKYAAGVGAFDIMAKSRDIFSRNKDEKFHVLNHGDLWINNIFFSYDANGDPVDAALVDFQECFWGSPGIDLNHFLYSSCDFDIHENHIDDLIKHYHGSLAKTLEKLGHSNIPSLADIRTAFNQKAPQSIVSLCTVVPIMMIENPEHANPEYFIAESEEASAVRRQVFSNPKFVEVLSHLLPKIAEKKLI